MKINNARNCESERSVLPLFAGQTAYSLPKKIQRIFWAQKNYVFLGLLELEQRALLIKPSKMQRIFGVPKNFVFCEFFENLGEKKDGDFTVCSIYGN
ncbi:hypothetical protein JW851_01450 [Candidatus Woesearchaeota archaeon]|nr:hypothetical protein [Candidatus Woesearchaeota archaeon]